MTDERAKQQAIEEAIEEIIEQAVANERCRVLQILKEANSETSQLPDARISLAKIHAAVLFGWASLEGKGW